jgi:hypothetical protein
MSFHRLFLATGSLALLAACHEQSTQTAQEPTAAAPTTPQCYAYRTDTDTVRRGTMHGDTLLADYTFQSEGRQSVREVAFLRRDIGFVEGYGPVTEQQGKTVFKLPRTLHFDAKYMLLPVACPQ